MNTRVKEKVVDQELRNKDRFSAKERNKMMLSQETLSGIHITGTTL